MLEKIPNLSFKDFFTYFVPGVVICTLVYDILLTMWHLYYIPSLGKIVDNPIIIVSLVVIAYVVGFFTSQAQIVLFHMVTFWFMDRWLYDVKNVLLVKKLTDNVDEKIKSVFQVGSVDRTKTRMSKVYFSLCEGYVMEKATPEVISQINRSKTYANLATVSIVPLTLMWISIVYRMNSTWNMTWSSSQGLSVIAFIYTLCINGLIIYNFKKGWATLIFSTFLRI